MQVDEVEIAGNLFAAAHAHWRELCGPDRCCPRPQELDPIKIPRPVLPYSELVEVVDDPLDFRYRLIGTAIDHVSASNYTGLSVREIPTQAPPSRMFDFFAAGYQRKAPLCARLPYVGPDGFVDSIGNLLLPFSDNGSGVSMFWSVVEIERRQPGAGT